LNYNLVKLDPFYFLFSYYSFDSITVKPVESYSKGYLVQSTMCFFFLRLDGRNDNSYMKTHTSGEAGVQSPIMSSSLTISTFLSVALEFFFVLVK